MIIQNQDNIKVHFAGAEQLNHSISIMAAKVNYGLGTAFPFVYKMFKNGKIDDRKLIKRISSNYNHFILDSGLFTLMFGSLKGKKDEAYLDKWYECLTDYVLHEEYNGTMVEVDCQKVLGVEKAWEYRIKMQDKVPNRIINVFHFEDGKKGLERLIEFSDYIAISVPELRFIKKKEFLKDLASYIKNKKPEIDIHLLGCTEKKHLSDLDFCTSADSTSWLAPVKFGHIDTLKGMKHIRNIKEDVYLDRYNKWINIKNKHFPNSLTPKNKKYFGIETFSAEQFLEIYKKYAGPQK
mgnify:CR=1 FL=1|tara:strand:+ start:2514 stop:3395 length:882 start_codon:yes stop_codon:yes gene_type:complete